jgi:hypothetical protein
VLGAELGGLGALAVGIVVLIWVEGLLELGYRGLYCERFVVVQL